MDKARRERLEARGYRVGSADEFLQLTPEESALLDIKLVLRRELKARRTALNLTQAELAERIGSSQSRIAKVERDDALPSLDQLVRLLLATGETRERIGRLVGSRAPADDSEHAVA